MNEKKATSEPIDVVYLWCDGTDPVFIRDKEKRAASCGIPYKEDNAGALRFVDNEELRYSLRSIQQNMPWVNHIFIVTNKQYPRWMKKHPKITIVDHREIMPHELLPTFNSVVIETFIHKIPGLSKKFIYFNDDVFIKNRVLPEFFFDKDRPIVRVKKGGNFFVPVNEVKCIELLKNDSVDDFRKSLLRSWYFVNKKNGYAPWVLRVHCADPFDKNVWQECLEKYPEVLKLNISPFRGGEDVQWPLIVNLEMILHGKGTYKLQKCHTNFFIKHFNNLLKKEVDWFEGAECDKTRSRILILNPMMFCINADIGMDDENRRRTRNFLKKMFPIPSDFEKIQL